MNTITMHFNFAMKQYIANKFVTIVPFSAKF